MEIRSPAAEIRELLSEHVIAVGALDRTTRRVLAGAVALMLAEGFLLALRDTPLLPGVLETVRGAVVDVPIPVAAAAVAGSAVAWSLMLAAAADAALPLRVAVLAIFTIAMLAVSSPLAAPHGLAPAAAGELILAATLAVAIGSGGRGSDRPRVRRAALILGGVAAFHAFYFGAGLSSGRAVVFLSGVQLELRILTLALIPMLVLAGVDFAEWGHELGGLSRILAERSPALLAVVALGLSAAVLADQARRRGALTGAHAVYGLVVLGAAATAWRMARLREWTSAIPARYLVAAVGCWFLVSAGASTFDALVTVRLGPPAAVRTHPAPRQFTYAAPNTWRQSEEAERDGLTAVVFALPDARGASFTVVALDPAVTGALPPPAAIIRALVGTAGFNAGAQRADGAWTLVEFQRTPLQGVAWVRTDPGLALAVIGLAAPADLERLRPQFRRAALSVAAGASAAPGSVPSRPPALAPMADGATAVALALGAVLLVLAGRRSGAGYFAIAGVVLGSVPVLGALRAAGFALPRLVELGALQIAVAAVTIGAVLALAAGRRLARGRAALATLVGLGVGLQVVSWVFGLYNASSSLQGRFSAVQGGVLVLGLTWDVVMSGSGITNSGSAAFPRHARVMLFCGYELLAVSCLLFFSSFRAPEGGVPGVGGFDSDAWPRIGMSIFGVALLLALAAARLSRERPSRGV